MNIKSIKMKNMLHIGAVLSVHLFFISNLFNKRIAVSDFSPFSGSFKDTFFRFFYVWNDKSIGEYAVSNYLHLFRSCFEIFNNPIIAQALFFLFLFSVAYYGVYKFFDQFNYNKYVKWVVPFFYIYNPAFAAELINGYTGAIVIYSLAPLLFLSIQKIFTKYSYSWGFSLSVLVAIFLLNIQIAFWWFVAVFIYIVFIFIYDNDRAAYIKSLVRLVGYGLIGVLLNLISFLTFFGYVGNLSSQSYISTFKYTYATTDFMNIFKMIGNNGSRQISMGYYESTFINILFFIFFILIVFFVLYGVKKRKKREKNIIIFSIFSLLLIGGVLNGIKMGYFDELIYQKNPIIVSLRSPVKLFYIFAFNFTILIGFAVNHFLDSVRRYGRRMEIVCGMFLLIIYVMFNAHFFSRDFGYSNVIENEAYYITSKYEVLSEVIENMDDYSNVLYLPFDYSMQLKTTWINGIVEQKMGSGMSRMNSIDSVQYIYQEICNANIEPLLQNNLNIEYVVLDKNPITYHTHKDKVMCENINFYGTQYIWGEYNFFHKLFVDSYVVYDDDEYEILKIKKNNSLVTLNGADIEFHKKSPVKYKIQINVKEGKHILLFHQNYHPGWKLYLNNNDIIFDWTHATTGKNINGWIIDSEYIKQNFSKKYYKENSDGSLDVDLVLYFKPQSYFYLGLLISGTIFIGLIGYLIYDWRKDRGKSRK